MSPKHLEREIASLKKKILRLGRIVQETLDDAVCSVRERDKELAKKIIENDIEIDRMEVATEEECLKILALYQPVAIDLRFIIGVLKMNNELERIADYAVNIAERGMDLASLGKVSLPAELFKMTEMVQTMVKKSIDAMFNMDAGLARDVCAEDDAVDEMHRLMYEKFKTLMAKDTKKIPASILILSMFRYLERVADHATNVAEDVVYMVEGEISRHGHNGTSKHF